MHEQSTDQPFDEWLTLACHYLLGLRERDLRARLANARELEDQALIERNEAELRAVGQVLDALAPRIDTMGRAPIPRASEQ